MVSCQDYIDRYLVYNAISLKLIRVQEVIDHLLTEPPTIKRQIAYRHLILTSDASQHYDKNGDFFLFNADISYIYIYSLSNGRVEIYPKASSKDLFSLTPYLYYAMMEIKRNPSLEKLLSLICDHPAEWPSADEAAIAIRAYSWNIMKTFQLEESPTEATLLISKSLLDIDRIDNIKKFLRPTDFFLLMTHMFDRKKNLAEYWSFVQEKYLKLLEELLAEGILPSRIYPEYLAEMFPDRFSKDRFSDLTWLIYQLPLHLQAYLLGFPIHINLPSRKEVSHRLEYLSEVGLEKFIEWYQEKTKKEIGELINQEDTLGEEINSYSLSDVVLLDENGKRYAFSRREISPLLSSSKNFWTRTALTRSQILYLIQRDCTRRIFHLPECIPLKDRLTELTEDKFEMRPDGIIYLNES